MSISYRSYSQFTASTARYPLNKEACYLALGLCDETCDELFSAYLRPRNDRSWATDLFLELGDAQWYLCRLCHAFEFDFSVVVSDAKVLYGRTPANDPLRERIANLGQMAGKIAGRVKKYERDGSGWNFHTMTDFREVLRGYLVQYVTRSFIVLDGIWRLDSTIGNYDACLQANMDKLSGRLDRGTLHGDGDHR